MFEVSSVFSGISLGTFAFRSNVNFSITEYLGGIIIMTAAPGHELIPTVSIGNSTLGQYLKKIPLVHLETSKVAKMSVLSVGLDISAIQLRGKV